jgi:hypothetical protein
MSPTEVQGVECACGDRFRRFSTWEAHREECEHYE